MVHQKTSVRYCKQKECLVLDYYFKDDNGKIIKETRKPEIRVNYRLWRLPYGRNKKN